MKTPTWWDILHVTLARLVWHEPVTCCDGRRDTILLDAAVAIRAGRYEQATSLLDPFATVLGDDAAYLNIFGVICEARKELKRASRFYGLAISVDPSFLPAQQNMRRVYEMNTFGQAREQVNLGDIELRANRRVSSTGRTHLFRKKPKRFQELSDGAAS